LDQGDDLSNTQAVAHICSIGGINLLHHQPPMRIVGAGVTPHQCSPDSVIADVVFVVLTTAFQIHHFVTDIEVYCTRSTAKESGVDVLPDKCEYRLFNRKTIVTIVTVVIAQLDVCLEEIQWAIAASGLMHDLLDWLHEYLVNLHCCATLCASSK
jgi:hypothetical protein